MRNLFIGLLALTSASVFADELIGLNCSTEYVLQEISRTPYDISRVVIRKSLLGGRSVLGYTPINNYIKYFSEGFNLGNSNESIVYSLNVQEETTVLSIKVNTNENEVTLLKDYQFKTTEGFTGSIYLSDLIQLGNQHATNVILTCLPAYK